MKKYIFFPALFLLFILFFFSKQITPITYAQTNPTDLPLYGTSACQTTLSGGLGGKCVAVSAPYSAATGNNICNNSFGTPMHAAAYCTVEGGANNGVVNGYCCVAGAPAATSTPIPAPTATPGGGQTGAVCSAVGSIALDGGQWNLSAIPSGGAVCLNVQRAIAFSAYAVSTNSPVIGQNFVVNISGGGSATGVIGYPGHPGVVNVSLPSSGASIPYTVTGPGANFSDQIPTACTSGSTTCIIPTPTTPVVATQTPTPTVTPTSSPTPTTTATATPTPTQGPACGTSCTSDTSCSGAGGGCSVCNPDSHTCQTPPACGTSCTSDTSCSGASGGCGSCVSGVCSTPNTTTLAFTVFLDDIGQYGDNANPKDTSLSNQSPLHPTLTLNVTVLDSNNTIVGSPSGTITYNSDAGNFTGTINMGDLPTGDYIIKAKTDGYLERLFSPIQVIQNNTTNIVPTKNMIAGDINDDNQLDIMDYNILLDCGYGALNPLPMSDPTSEFNSPVCQSHDFKANADLNDNGIVDSHDYNLFARELSIQAGD